MDAIRIIKQKIQIYRYDGFGSPVGNKITPLVKFDYCLSDKEKDILTYVVININDLYLNIESYLRKIVKTIYQNTYFPLDLVNIIHGYSGDWI